MREFFRRYPAHTYKRIFHIAAPLILINATQTVMQLSDRKFLSMISSEHLGAALPGGVLAFTMGAFFFVTTAFATPLIAQHFGKKEYDACARIPWTAFWFALAAGLVCTYLISPLGAHVIQFFDHAQPNIAALEHQYYTTIMPGLGFSFVMVAFTCFFSGRGITWVPAVIQVMVCVINLFLNWVLIFGEFGFPRLEMAGAGLGTTLSNLCGALFAFLFFIFYANQKIFPTRRFRYPEWLTLKRLLRFGAASGFQVFSEVGAFTVVIFLIGQLGLVAKATCTIAMSINLIAFLPLIGLSEAVCIIVGQSIGRRRLGQAQSTVYEAWQVASVYMCLTGLAFVLFADPMINCFAPTLEGADQSVFTDVLVQGRTVLMCVACYSFFDAILFVFMGAMRGAGDTTVPMIIVSGAHWCLWVPMVALLVHLNLPVLYIWGYLVFHMMVIAFLLVWRFRSGAWRKVRVMDSSAPIRHAVDIPTPEYTIM